MKGSPLKKTMSVDGGITRQEVARAGSSVVRCLARPSDPPIPPPSVFLTVWQQGDSDILPDISFSIVSRVLYPHHTARNTDTCDKWGAQRDGLRGIVACAAVMIG